MARGTAEGEVAVSDRTRLELIEGEPRVIPLTIAEVDPFTSGETPLDVAATAVALHVHERDADAEVFAPLAITALSPNVAGRGEVTFSSVNVAAMATDKEYVGRLRKESGESLDVVDIAVLRAWR